ncbi:tRNA adenosine(34) deaminase TadA [Veillonella sp.]|uniref:tRNA adenosine(34) deaminase TadA n=1 Tax=Veillonella sp. TaxID=1926307 RepID=UPI0025EC7B89|nr:tRNA adenosine(34) deaminase TadA [Veillonella sp.]
MTKDIKPIEIENMDERTRDEYFMAIAMEEARKAYELGEIPIGAILVKDNTIVSRHHNRRELDHDATAHAEVLVIREACDTLKRWRLTGCTLYVTIEPCPMCAGAIINSRIDRVVYGASDYKGGAVESLFNVLSHPGLNHEPELASGVLGDECRQIMKDFFKERRKTRRSTQEAEGSALEMR